MASLLSVEEVTVSWVSVAEYSREWGSIQSLTAMVDPLSEVIRDAKLLFRTPVATHCFSYQSTVGLSSQRSHSSDRAL